MSKIVVVDDSYSELQMLEGYLKSANYTVVSYIKNDERFKNIPIVLVTSKNQESDKFWGQQQGASEYVVKPFKPEDLLAAVKRAMR